MTPNEIIRSNVRAILPYVRGKSVKQRQQIYASLMMGPIGVSLLAIQAALSNHENIFDDSLNANVRPRWDHVGDPRPRH